MSCTFPIELNLQKRPLLLNTLHWFCLLTLWAISVIGLLLNVPDLENSLVTPKYVNGELIAFDVIWFVLLVAWTIFAAVKAFRRRLWPSLYSKKDKSYLARVTNLTLCGCSQF